MRIKSSFSKYDVEQGFEEHQSYSEPVMEIKRQLPQAYSLPIPQTKTNSRLSNKKQQAKLRFISIDRSNNRSSNYDYLKQEQQKMVHKSMTLDKDDNSTFSGTKKRNRVSQPLNKLPPLDNYTNSVCKIKRYFLFVIQARSQIGENLQFVQHNSVETKLLKESLINQGAALVFEDHRQSNSHGLFKKFLKLKNSNNFLRSKYNTSLLQKISTSYINPRNEVSSKLNQLSPKKPLQFVSDFESSNLDFVTQINPYEYDLYIKADTNTMGHQNWFYFKLLNNSEDKKSVFLNVCNLKRGFKLIKRGQKIFYRLRKINKTSIKTSIQNDEEEWSDWQKIEQQVSVTAVYETLPGDKNRKKKMYRLSFSSNLLPQMEYEFSLLPPFTYSQMLKEVQKIQNSCKYVEVQTLTFSLLGLCIPVLTFTNKQAPNQKKNVILVSARIHPGETCASYVAKGVLQKLSEENQHNDDFLSKHIIKIIPMLNPDGVVLGNFRTNYLGNDLNRAFNQQNQVTFPQIYGLKEIGRKLKQQFKDRFLCFLDLHGHSSQKNIFVYGPNYEQNHRFFVNSRFLPKTLSYLTEQFDYDKCTFTLEECKANTARGYFLKCLKTMAFTIESSYALFDSNKSPQVVNQDLKIQNLICFGENIIKGISMWTRSMNVKSESGKNEETEGGKLPCNLQKIEGEDFLVIGRIRKQLTKESANLRKKIKKRKHSQQDEQSSAEDTDGQSQSEDIPVKEREKLQKKFIELNNDKNLFPRILRPAIVHPQVNPPMPLFSVSKINVSESIVKGSVVNPRVKRNRYQNVKSVNVNNAYTEYLLKEVKGLQFLRPSVNLMKLSRKESVLMGASISEMK